MQLLVAFAERKGCFLADVVKLSSWEVSVWFAYYELLQSSSSDPGVDQAASVSQSDEEIFKIIGG